VQIWQGRGSNFAQRGFGLNNRVRTYVEGADRGTGILFIEQGRVPFYNKLTNMEYSYFTPRGQRKWGRNLRRLELLPASSRYERPDAGF
jgi:hypothetical protein